MTKSGGLLMGWDEKGKDALLLPGSLSRSYNHMEFETTENAAPSRAICLSFTHTAWCWSTLTGGSEEGVRGERMEAVQTLPVSNAPQARNKSKPSDAGASEDVARTIGPKRAVLLSSSCKWH